MRRSFLCLIALFALAFFQGYPKALAQDTDEPQEAFDPGQVESIEEIVRRYLLENPEVIIEAVTEYQNQRRLEEEEQQRARISANLDRLQNDPRSPVVGNVDGDVVIVEFFDYKCPYCKVTAPRLQTVVAEDSGVKVVLKEYPILSQESVDAARAALAAHKQGKYEAFHFTLMDNPGDLSVRHLRAVAERVGVDADLMFEDMESEEITQAIRDNHRLARELGVTGTPALFVGTSFAPGAVELEQLRELIEVARNGET
jgi:protein-disulfide isomerase